MYHDANYANLILPDHGVTDANPILPDDTSHARVHIPNIPVSKDLQIPSLIPDTTSNTRVPYNTGVRKYNETTDKNTS